MTGSPQQRPNTVFSILAILTLVGLGAATTWGTWFHVESWISSGTRLKIGTQHHVQLFSGEYVFFFESPRVLPQDSEKIQLLIQDHQANKVQVFPLPFDPEEQYQSRRPLSGDRLLGRAMWKVTIPVDGVYSLRCQNTRSIQDPDHDRLVVAKSPPSFRTVKSTSNQFKVAGFAMTGGLTIIFYLFHGVIIARRSTPPSGNVRKRNRDSEAQAQPVVETRHPTWALIALGGILLVGGLLRATYLLELSGKPDFSYPTLDHLYHDYWARTLVFDDVPLPSGAPEPRINSNAYFRPPGYSFFLAGVYRTLGTNPHAPRIVQMLLGMTTCLVGYLFAKRWFGTCVALTFAGMLSVSWIFIYYEGKLNAPSLLVVLAMLLVYILSQLIERDSLGLAFLAGVVLGLYALVRPNVLTFALAVLIWLYWVKLKSAQPRRFLAPAATFLLGVTLTIAPATLRNYAVSKDFVLISANGGINFFFGNNDYSQGIEASHPEIGSWSCFDYSSIVHDLETRLNRPLSYAEASSHFTDRGLRFIADHPHQALQLTARKLGLFWAPVEVSNYENDATFEKHHSPLLKQLPFPFPAILALAITGLALFGIQMLQRRRATPGPWMDPDRNQVHVVSLIVLFILFYSATIVAFIVSGRYRLPIIPFLLLGSAFGIVKLAELLRRRDWNTLHIWCGILAAVSMLTCLNWPDYRPTPDVGHEHLAAAYIRAGNWQKAEAELQKGVRLNPSNTACLLKLAVALSQRGELTEAARRYSQAVSLDPHLLEAHLALGKISAGAGSFRQAAVHFRAALNLHPDSEEANLCMGSVLTLAGKKEAAASHYLKVLQNNPRQGDAHLLLGELRREQGRLDEAVDHLRKALELNPQHEATRTALSKAQAEQALSRAPDDESKKP
ncbi:MAG: hypothetical protein CMJ81_04095 [Planctomycetaceae bacterium]|nr:hypothetical protein [Planctomycetaceae bacterium]MBP62746.1 hypothetical protein [Planctomycetaceae bacterium]